MCERAVMFSDLDGTLIFSAAKRQPGDILCETKDGQEISCITARQAELLPGLDIIPVTTRSIEQFRRITIPGFRPEYALADNGGTLLVNGIPDPAWTADSMRLVRECSRELAECRRVLESDPCRCFEIRMVDGMFLFTKSGDPESTVAKLSEAAGERVRCYSTGAKVYALPAGLCKGAAAARLAERIAPHRRIICAGDSMMDVPLLDIADVAVFPEDMRGAGITAPEVITAPRERFPEFVTEYFARIKDRQ